MNPSEAVNALSLEFNTVFPTMTPTCDIYWEAAPATTPPALGDSWVRFGVHPGQQELNALGSPRIFTNGGIISVQIFTPQGRGRGGSDALAVSVVGVFLGRTDIGDGIRIQDIRYTTLGSTEGFFQQNVMIEYEADNLVS